MSTFAVVSDVVQAIRDRLGNQADGIQDAELIRMVNLSWARVQDLVHHNDDRWFRSTMTQVIASGSVLNLPGDWYKIQMVEANDGSDVNATSGWHRIVEYDETEEDIYDGLNSFFDLPRYRVKPQAGIQLIPDPELNRAYRISYTPTAQHLTGSGDTFETFNFWEEAVIADVAHKVALRMGLRDLAAAFALERKEQMERIETAVSTRNTTEEPKFRDHYGPRGGYRGGWPSW